MLCHFLTPGVFGRKITIGILCDTSPNSWQYLFGAAGAITIAIDRLIDEGIVENGTISRYILTNKVVHRIESSYSFISF